MGAAGMQLVHGTTEGVRGGKFVQDRAAHHVARAQGWGGDPATKGVSPVIPQRTATTML